MPRYFIEIPDEDLEKLALIANNLEAKLCAVNNIDETAPPFDMTWLEQAETLRRLVRGMQKGSPTESDKPLTPFPLVQFHAFAQTLAASMVTVYNGLRIDIPREISAPLGAVLDSRVEELTFEGYEELQKKVKEREEQLEEMRTEYESDADALADLSDTVRRHLDRMFPSRIRRR